jgi:hypothetical protein
MPCRTTLVGCWGCGRPWESLRYEPLAYDQTDTAYYCERCDVYSKKLVHASPASIDDRKDPTMLHSKDLT